MHNFVNAINRSSLGFSTLLCVEWKHWGHQAAVVMWLQSEVSGRGQISLWETQSVSCSYTRSLTQTHHPGAAWQARPSLTLAGFCWHGLSGVLLFYLLLQIANCNTVWLWNICTDFYHEKHTSKTERPPKAFRITLRKVSRTVITRYNHTAMALNTNAPRQRAFDVKSRENFRNVSFRLFGNKVNPSSTSSPRAGRCSQLATHIRLWQWQIKVVKAAADSNLSVSAHIISRCQLNWAKKSKDSSGRSPAVNKRHYRDWIRPETLQGEV